MFNRFTLAVLQLQARQQTRSLLDEFYAQFDQTGDNYGSIYGTTGRQLGQPDEQAALADGVQPQYPVFETRDSSKQQPI